MSYCAQSFADLAAACTCIVDEVNYCEPDQATIIVNLPVCDVTGFSTDFGSGLDKSHVRCVALQNPETTREEGEGTPLSGSFEMVNRQDGDHAHILPIRTGDLSSSALE